MKAELKKSMEEMDDDDSGAGPSPLSSGPSQHGLSSHTMALITSDCDAMRLREHQLALITSGCAPSIQERWTVKSSMSGA